MKIHTKSKSRFLAIFGILFITAVLTFGCLMPQNSFGNINGSNLGEAIPNTAGIVYNETNFTNDPVEGSANAPVTIVEFSDFECPYCARFATQTYPQIKQNYIDTGKVKLVYKYFPLSSMHPYAYKAAEAAECAHQQGKFWFYSDILYTYNNELTISDLKKYAMQLGLDTKKFNDCLDSGKSKHMIDKDFNEGMKLGVGNKGTPFFFINGIGIVGAQPYIVFKQKIDEALNKTK